MQTVETRAQTLAKLDFYIPRLSDRELRLLVAFARGLDRDQTAKEA